jgi:hypothetical protein
VHLGSSSMCLWWRLLLVGRELWHARQRKWRVLGGTFKDQTDFHSWDISVGSDGPGSSR